jgi:hypothetical protein
VKWLKIFLVAFAVLVLRQSANACEPILPFMKVVGGPAMLTGSWIALIVAVATKSVLQSERKAAVNAPHSRRFARSEHACQSR